MKPVTERFLNELQEGIIQGFFPTDRRMAVTLTMEEWSDIYNDIKSMQRNEQEQEACATFIRMF